jgi:hypothetical protein
MRRTGHHTTTGIMIDATLGDAISSLFAMNLNQVLIVVGIILLASSATVKALKTNRDSLVFIGWGIGALLVMLLVRWWLVEPDLVSFLEANGWPLTVAVHAAAGVLFGAMSHGLWRVFFRPRGRVVQLSSSACTPRRAASSGRKDGRIGVNPRHYEESLLHFGEQNANHVTLVWHESDKKLKTAYCDAISRQRTAESALERAAADRIGPCEDYAREQERYKSTYASHHLGTFAYWFIIALIGIAEFPFNLTALRTVLGEIEIIVILFSLIVSGIFAFAIHSLGQFFAENPFEKGLRKAIAKNPIPIFSAVFLALVIVGFARFRESYIAAFQEQLSGYDINYDISPGLAAGILGLLLAFFAIIAIDVGRRRYRPDIAERRTALAGTRKRHREAEERMSRADRANHRALRRRYKAETARRGEFAAMRAAVEAVNKRIHEVIKTYRTHYERAAKKKRPGDAVSFDALPVAEMPQGLTVLDETCFNKAAEV